MLIINDDQKDEKNITNELFVLKILFLLLNIQFFRFYSPCRNEIQLNSYKSGVDQQRFISIQLLQRLLKVHCKTKFFNLNFIWNENDFRTPWRDDEETLIDRFDVRSHLDIIDEYALRNQQTQQASESVLFQFVALVFFLCQLET